MMPKWQRKTSFKGLNGVKRDASFAPLFWCYYPQRPARDNSRAKAHITLEEHLTKQANKRGVLRGIGVPAYAERGNGRKQKNI